jgi:solute carrier family 25 (adenine nucleotide translocator) protein 4/5/6/31
LNFAFKGQVKNIPQLTPSKTDSYAVSLAKNITAGGLAGGGSLAFVYSLDYARTRLSNDLKGAKKGGTREFNGLLDVYRKTWATDGFVGLYRGFNISFVGIFVYRGLYFGLYDTIMPLFPVDKVNLATRFAVGYGVTVLAGLASYPIDTIRRRMMMTSGSQALQYRNSFHCAQTIMAAEGFSSFFKGAGANILRGIAGAGVLAGFDTVADFYVKQRYGADAYTNIQFSG